MAMLELSKEQRYIILGLVGLIISALLYAVFERYLSPSDEVFVAKPDTIPRPAVILVHVSGAVNKQGVFKLGSGSRILDAVNAAGGFCPDADPSAVNLAQELKDGIKIVIPARRKATPKDKDNKNGLININSAPISELKTIPGVGDVTAGRIVEYRETSGGFSTTDELKKVKGIGPKKFEKMKDSVTVN